MKHYSFLFLLLLIISSCGEYKTVDLVPKEFKGIPIIRLDKEAVSGIGLKPVQNKDQPERRLFQKRLIRGSDLSVYVVSSETATAQQNNYGMEEYIKLINGQSRMNPINGEEVIFETGESFIAPKGFTGEWETLGGDEFLIELSIITTDRVNGDVSEPKTLPYLLDKKARSGLVRFSATENSDSKLTHKLYAGIELTVTLENITPQTIEISHPMQEQIVEVLSGKITITPKKGSPEAFVHGDYFMIPRGFIGTFEYEGHGIVRTMHILKSDNSTI